MEKISIVIPMIHEYPSIYGTVNSLQAELLDCEYDWEIIVAENGTVDKNTPNAFTGPKALYRTLMSHGKLKYCFDDRQCGPVSRNTGARLATGDYVMFMDAHTSPGKNTIAPLATFLKDNEQVGCVQGLTAWSYYDYTRMGAYYELFHPHDKQIAGGGGPTLASHMHGHYMTPGHVQGPWRKLSLDKKPFMCVMGSQAYTMYRRDEFLKLGGYFDEARFYPHPEGYMPLKVWMSGKQVYTHPLSWHLHGMYPRQYSQSKEETQAKIDEYGGLSWADHGMRNVFMVALILGDVKWLQICVQAFKDRKTKETLVKVAQSAINTVENSGEYDRLHNLAEMSLDEVLINARKKKIPGMEHWFNKIGPDPK